MSKKNQGYEEKEEKGDENIIIDVPFEPTTAMIAANEVYTPDWETDDDIEEGLTRLPYVSVVFEKITKQSALKENPSGELKDSIRFILLASMRGLSDYNYNNVEPKTKCESKMFRVKNDAEMLKDAVGELNDDLPAKVAETIKADGAGGRCAACRRKNWGQNREKPICGRKISLLCFDLDSGIPFIFYAKSTALTPVTNLFNMINAQKMTQKMIGKVFPSEAFIIEMSTKPILDKTYQYAEPVFKFVSVVPDLSKIKVFQEIKKNNMDVFERRSQEEIVDEANGEANVQAEKADESEFDPANMPM